MKEYPHLNDLYISQRLRKRLSNIGKSRITTVTAERPHAHPPVSASRIYRKVYVMIKLRLH